MSGPKIARWGPGSQGADSLPLGDRAGNRGIFMLRMNDSLAASISFWLASDTIPASVTTVAVAGSFCATCLSPGRPWGMTSAHGCRVPD
jgi:hypothetical protein